MAVSWLHRSLGEGCGLGVPVYARCLLEGRGVEKDERRGWAMLRGGMERGHAESMCVHAEYSIYLKAGGMGVGTLPQLYGRAIRMGCSAAMVHWGILLEGQGASQEAVRWYRKAAALDSPLGMSGIATMYAVGAGVSPSTLEALRWHRKAAEIGYSPSVQFIDDLLAR